MDGGGGGVTFKEATGWGGDGFGGVSLRLANGFFEEGGEGGFVGTRRIFANGFLEDLVLAVVLRMVVFLRIAVVVVVVVAVLNMVVVVRKRQDFVVVVVSLARSKKLCLFCCFRSFGCRAVDMSVFNQTHD